MRLVGTLLRNSAVTRFLVAVALAPALACGGSDPDLAAVTAKLVGIYQLATRTQNDTTCDTEGPTVPGTSTTSFFFILKDRFSTNLYVYPCDTAAACHTRANAITGGTANAQQADPDVELPTPVATDDNTVTATGIEAGQIVAGEQCTSGSVAALKLIAGDNHTLRFEGRITKGANYPATGGTAGARTCTTDGVAASADGKPCSSLLVLTGTFAEAL